MLDWLQKLHAAAGPARCLYLPPGLPLPEVEKTVAGALDLKKAPPDLVQTAAGSATGAALFYDDKEGYLVWPPFPITQKHAADTYHVEPLCSILSRELTTAVILVRLGEYAIGVFHDEELVSSKVGTGNVHGRHRQGGSSAHRFERHREKQIETFFTRVCGHIREHLEPYLKQLDYVIYGGTRETLLEFRRQCHFLQQLNDRTLSVLLNVREPKQATLESAIDQVWSSRVIHWQEAPDIEAAPPKPGHTTPLH